MTCVIVLHSECLACCSQKLPRIIKRVYCCIKYHGFRLCRSCPLSKSSLYSLQLHLSNSDWQISVPFPLPFMQKTKQANKKPKIKQKKSKSVINPSLCIVYINTPCNCLSLLVLVLCPLFFSFVLWLPQHYYSQPWNSSCKCRKHAHPFRKNWMACIKETIAPHLLVLVTKSIRRLVLAKDTGLRFKTNDLWTWEHTVGLGGSELVEAVYYSICT